MSPPIAPGLAAHPDGEDEQDMRRDVSPASRSPEPDDSMESADAESTDVESDDLPMLVDGEPMDLHGLEEGEGNGPTGTTGLRRSTRVSKPTQFFGLGVSTAGFSSDPSKSPINTSDPVEPQSYEEAISGPEAQLWKQSIQEEYDSLMKNGPL